MCQRCTSLEREYRQYSSAPHSFIVHADRSIITGPGRNKEVKKGKKKILQDIVKKVSALRNTLGGHLLVHLHGQKEGDKYLEYFHEFVDKTLQDLIECGSSYVDTYHTTWLNEIPCFETFKDVLLINVALTCGISTANVNTKICNDFENTSPTTFNLVYLLAHSQYEASRGVPALKGIDQDKLQLYQESQNVELKLFCPKNDISHVQYIWEDLKLKDNITSMSKVPGGGSYYVGVEERVVTESGYKTKVPHFVGFQVDNPEELKEGLHIMVNKELCVLSFTGEFGDPPSDLVQIGIHRLPGVGNKCVLEVAVRFFGGIVFCDKQGPIIYEIQNHGICRMERTEWLRRILQLPSWKVIQTNEVETESEHNLNTQNIIYSRT
ncbi:uncharacterized protein LOC124117601 [Haliotis rufescens]|uniref:uncharacterized protein LOC124117601 n=1 Tax=Haliotis rufescens TaxID=6454 RepID=UPI00201E9083|nr:uncharacterized protein LOC124117601 [Haliotis rufescens]